MNNETELEGASNPKMCDWLTEELWSLYKHYLQVSCDSEVEFGYDIFKDDPVYNDPYELWEEPEGFETLIYMGDVRTPGLSVGCISFGTWKGRRIIMEQNASPFAVYCKRLEEEI